jgi:hypothetical protein
LTSDNFTPRPEKDTVGAPGQAPGLSTFISLTLAPRQKAQAIDVGLLQPPLAAIADDPQAGGMEGHVAITPVDGTGQINQQQLDEWASFRGTGRMHAFTQIVLDAVVEVDVR